MAHVTKRNSGSTLITDPPIARLLFSDTRIAWLWLPFRLWLGWTWLESGWGKVQGTGWLDGGSSLQGFWQRAIAVDPKPVIAFDWYRAFIQFLLDSGAYVWFAKVISLGEIAIGIALILGAFTGLAAFGGSLMNWNFIMAGSASVNAVLFAVATGLVLAWKTAGWIGLDRWLLPALGTPWTRGRVFTLAGDKQLESEHEAPVERARAS